MQRPHSQLQPGTLLRHPAPPPAPRRCTVTALRSAAMLDIGSKGPSLPRSLPPGSNRQNITFDGQPYSTLRGFNDLSNIDLRQVGATGGQFASLASVLSFGSSTTPLNIAPGGSVSVGAGGTVTLGAGGTIAGPGGNVTMPTGGTITCGGGTITLGNGGNVTLGGGGTITITAGSNGVIAVPPAATSPSAQVEPSPSAQVAPSRSALAATSLSALAAQSRFPLAAARLRFPQQVALTSYPRRRNSHARWRRQHHPRRWWQRHPRRLAETSRSVPAATSLSAAAAT